MTDLNDSTESKNKQENKHFPYIEKQGNGLDSICVQDEAIADKLLPGIVGGEAS